jgi:hypothetical protein
MKAQHPPHGDWILMGGMQESLRKSSYSITFTSDKIQIKINQNE